MDDSSALRAPEACQQLTEQFAAFIGPALTRLQAQLDRHLVAGIRVALFRPILTDRERFVTIDAPRCVETQRARSRGT